MNIPKVARYDYCCAKANEFLINENITKLPFDSDKIIKKYKWSKLKYSSLAKMHDVPVADICEAYDSEDGYSIYNGKNYSIAYNDTISTKQRIYFTKLHEIGHIYLGHFVDFNETILKRTSMTENEYKVLENEANCFARNVLVPVVLINELGIKTSDEIKSTFGITSAASKTRYNLLKNDLYNFSSEDLELQKSLFYDYINKKRCFRCGHFFISETAKYCPICGYDRFARSDGKMIYDDGFKLDDKSRAIQCPNCDNEQMATDGAYCKICGTYLINRCTNDGDNYNNDVCGMIASGNARYCEYCGSKTTFYNQNLLKDWQETKLEIKRATDEAAATIEPDIDDLPF